MTTNTYDSNNNLLTSTDPLGHVTTRTYDSNNNLLTYKDALNNTTTWTYNANSQPITKTLLLGGAYAYAYTAGELTQVTDPNGIVTSFSYDSDGRTLTSTDALGNVTTYTYDAVGNRLQPRIRLTKRFPTHTIIATVLRVLPIQQRPSPPTLTMVTAISSRRPMQ